MISEKLPLTGGDERDAPLAHRMRPQSLDEFLGQQHLLAPGKPLREGITRGRISSMVFWGPPGCGKTTLARLLANHTDKYYVPFSAVTEGVPRVREVIREARQRRAVEDRGTLLFCDEIHRFNKAQQDAFLPSVEEGLITLVGATTENPSFELNSALLSRLRVFVLEPLSEDDIHNLLQRAIERLADDAPGTAPLQLDETALALLAQHADGDARSALTALEAVWTHVTHGRHPREQALDAAAVAALLQRRLPRYDKAGEQHFNLISALHKAVRGSDPDGALYWLARMIDAGEDPLYIARRIVRMAAEDIGLADPRAVGLALEARNAYQFLGSPEGDLALAQIVIYLCAAPKSNRAYKAWNQALEAARTSPGEQVPLHLRNAPTRLTKELGYGAGYRYDHNEGGHAGGQQYLPDRLRDSRWYEPGNQGLEAKIAERLRWFADRRDGS